jgi:hypothetical protein
MAGQYQAGKGHESEDRNIMSAIFHHAMQYEWVERKHTSIEHEQAGSTEQGCEDDGSKSG